MSLLLAYSSETIKRWGTKIKRKILRGTSTIPGFLGSLNHLECTKKIGNLVNWMLSFFEKNNFIAKQCGKNNKTRECELSFTSYGMKRC